MQRKCLMCSPVAMTLSEFSQISRFILQTSHALCKLDSMNRSTLLQTTQAFTHPLFKTSTKMWAATKTHRRWQRPCALLPWSRLNSRSNNWGFRGCEKIQTWRTCMRGQTGPRSRWNSKIQTQRTYMRGQRKGQDRTQRRRKQLNWQVKHALWYWFYLK